MVQDRKEQLISDFSAAAEKNAGKISRALGLLKKRSAMADNVAIFEAFLNVDAFWYTDKATQNRAVTTGRLLGEIFAECDPQGELSQELRHRLVKLKSFRPLAEKYEIIDKGNIDIYLKDHSKKSRHISL